MKIFLKIKVDVIRYSYFSLYVHTLLLRYYKSKRKSGGIWWEEVISYKMN